MKRYIRVLVVVSIMAMITPVFAGSTIFGKDTHSLFGIEVGYNNINVNGTNSDDTFAFDANTDFANVALKIGAESENYRIFLSGRYNEIDDFDYSYMMGAELQYLLNFSRHVNLFVGISAGIAEMKYIDQQNYVRTISDPYFGGDIGINYHLNEEIDLELGLRYISLDAYNLKNGVEYKFDAISSVYTSVIFKF